MRGVYIGLALTLMVILNFLNSGKGSSKTNTAVIENVEVENRQVLEEVPSPEVVETKEIVFDVAVAEENKDEEEPAKEESAKEVVAEEPEEESAAEDKEETVAATEDVKVIEEPVVAEVEATSETQRRAATVNGDPHIMTWKGEHYEYHGQCDLVLTKDPDFADGLGLDIHIRTKLVRFWSYVKTVAIRIGTDILEVQGATDNTINNYWYNFELQGELETMGGFPVSFKNLGTHKREFEIDLNKSHPNQKIVVQIYKEFVRVNFLNSNEESFGKTVGLLGDYKTGNTLARDGATVLDDFYTLGQEWQVHPFEPKLFHTMEEPQFPKKCIEPEDPRGERRRRLGESSVTEAQAEAACAVLKDPLDRKDCIYDILATQDLDMVGAF